MNGESIGKTLLVAAGVALGCSLMVSTTVSILRPMQSAYATIERSRVILETAGLATRQEAVSDRQIINRFLDLDALMVQLGTGEFARDLDPLNYDQRAAANDPAMSVSIPEDRDIAKLGRRARFAPVYLITRDNRIDRIVLPVSGQGMWSKIYGYICLAGDFNTVAGISFYEHGETPGIGDRIQDPEWSAQWNGKKVYDASGTLAIQVVKSDAAIMSAYQVDVISGASVTTQSVGNIVRYWLGDDAFGPLLARLAKNENRLLSAE